MIEPTLVEALDDSINRLAHGASIADCLQRYPAYRGDLERLLTAGQFVRQAQASAEEARQARDRQQFRFEQVLNERRPPARRFALQGLAQWAAVLVLVMGLFAGGTIFAAESSLPGDALYGVKRLTESVRLTLAPDDAALAQAFTERRFEEARQITSLKRTAELTLTGKIDRLTDTTLVIEGLSISTADIADEGAALRTGAQVEINVYSTSQGELRAQQVRVLNAPSEPSILPTFTQTRSAPVELVVTATPRASNTPEATRPQSTRTHTPLPTRTPQPTAHADQPTSTNAASGACQPARPSGWVAYTVQPGDSLSQLAAETGGSMETIASTNCQSNTRLIVAGQSLYLPRAPQRTPSPELQRTSDAMATQAGEHRGASDNGSDGTTDRQQEQQGSGGSDSSGRRGG